jgi:hydrogenase expression/formation protein HypD
MINGGSIEANMKIMEVCGTHTMAISKYGIRQMVSQKVDLISGPGCPVCVTPIEDIDHVIGVIDTYDVTVFTFGDLIRVPGTYSSLFMEKSKGRDIRICYSPMEALDFAIANPSRQVIFVSIGFETTAPLSAVLAKKAKDLKLRNFFIYCANKLVIPALKALVNDEEIQVGGFLLPGHVSAVIGSKPYAFIPRIFKIPCVISGFEASDILESIGMLLKETEGGNTSEVIIQYQRVVRPEGNKEALKYMKEVFKEADSIWRGLGLIPGSGLVLRKPFTSFDAARHFMIDPVKSVENKACRCGDVLKGIIKPVECSLFSKKCTPDRPVGPCMVSSEGSCAAYFKYEKISMMRKS